MKTEEVLEREWPREMTILSNEYVRETICEESIGFELSLQRIDRRGLR